MLQCSKISDIGCGDGQVVHVLAFYSDDPSLNPDEGYNFYFKIVVEKSKNKQKEATGFDHFSKEKLRDIFVNCVKSTKLIAPSYLFNK